MSQDLITAAQALIQRRHKYGWSPEVDAAIEELDKALFRQRSSVESVELPEPYQRLDKHLSHPVLRKVLFEPGDYYTASTVRSLIAAAVERERESVIQFLEGLEGFVGVREVAAAIRALGKK